MYNNNNNNKNDLIESKGKEKEKQAFAAKGISIKSFSNKSPTLRAYIIVNTNVMAYIFNDEKWFLYINKAID